MTKNEEIVGDAILEVLSGCGDVDIEAGIGWVFQEPLSPEAKVLRDKLGAIALGTNPWTAEPGEVFAHVKSLGDGSIFIHFPKADHWMELSSQPALRLAYLIVKYVAVSLWQRLFKSGET